MPPHPSRLSATDRRNAILAAAAPIFARLGREGATTKEIARAAGVSEALLYRHFTGKEALYAALERHCVEANTVGDRLLASAPPSTATLVTGVAVLVQAVFPGIGPARTHDDTKRLVTASLLGDGRFAKAFLDRHVKPWTGIFAQSFQAARIAGDVEDGVEIGSADIWFVHHLANTLHLISLPGIEVVEYGVPREKLVEKTVHFLLRGLGLRQAAIDRHYDPNTLRTIFASMERHQP
ncbi:TetR/AcrR family transcriptional regulator [Gluconacetobacter sacchari]|uniref:Helix-turn-helix transcriptional regulator n=2 Tax=Gluconacetobacter sacchari TaxID=92759 RepID=A0A7W4I9I2_9PROT|nr:helix-turn-helix domain-containing protein [Gluconacetobacter sacchari]MBB2158762.1 helix-turn-helix transcriptional regulator [Gluconacetobacter sacchari]GBQ21945.1 TetR family transcriptional regulator [Gluconacetobacter sacchari DSM 12717]